MGAEQHAAFVKAARDEAAPRLFSPVATVKCEGRPTFRSRVCRDLACLFDVDPEIRSWICMPAALDVRGQPHIPDFAAFYADGGMCFYDAPDHPRRSPQELISEAARKSGWRYRRPSTEEIYDGFRLRNAKDLLRYGKHSTPLGDRIRVLAALGEYGSLTVAECLGLFRESTPMAGLSSLILREQLVELDMDDALIGPDTAVRRIGR